MTIRKNLVAIGSEAQDAEHAQPGIAEPVGDAQYAEDPIFEEEWVDEEAEPQLGRLGWVLPTLAVLAVLAWTAFCIAVLEALHRFIVREAPEEAAHEDPVPEGSVDRADAADVASAARAAESAAARGHRQDERAAP